MLPPKLSGAEFYGAPVAAEQAPNGGGSSLPIDDLLRLMEWQGGAGGWHWVFATGEQAWSPGLYRLLGLDPSIHAPSYDLLRTLAHHEDRDRLPTTWDVRQGIIAPRNVFRILTPAGAMRTLSARHELMFAPDGRPLAVSGVVLDTSDSETLTRALDRKKQRSVTLAREAFIMNYVSPDSDAAVVNFDHPSAFQPSPDEIACDSYQIVAHLDRCRARDMRGKGRSLNRTAQGAFHFRKAGGIDVLCRAVEVPVNDDVGNFVEWHGLIFPLQRTVSLPSEIRDGLGYAVRGSHFRAARALLGWSMVQFAMASGLSLSTIRRLEDDLPSTGRSTRSRTISALRQAGIRFSLLDDNTIAVSRA